MRSPWQIADHGVRSVWMSDAASSSNEQLTMLYEAANDVMVIIYCMILSVCIVF